MVLWGSLCKIWSVITLRAPSAMFQNCWTNQNCSKLLRLLAPSQPWLNALLHKKRLKCGCEAITDLLIWQTCTPETCNSDCCQMQWQEDEYCEAKSEIDQLAKVLVGSQHKVPFNCRAFSNTPYYTSFTYYTSQCGLQNSNLRRLKWVFLLLLGRTYIPV